MKTRFISARRANVSASADRLESRRLLSAGSLHHAANAATAPASPAAAAALSAAPRAADVALVAERPDLQAGSDSGLSDSDNVTNVTSPVFDVAGPAGAMVTLFRDGVPVGSRLGSGAIQDTGPVPAGTHQYVTKVNGVGGGDELRVAIFPFAPSPSAPTLQSVSDSGNPSDRITNARTLSFNAGVTQGTSGGDFFDSIILLKLLRDGAAVASVYAPRDGIFPLVDGGPIAEGTHVYTLVQLDLAGNISAPSPGQSVIIDRTPPPAPSAPLLAPADDTGPSNSDNITRITMLDFTVTGVELGARVTLQRDKTTVGTALATASSLRFTDRAPGSGTYTYTVFAADAAGNTGPTSSTQVTVQATAPSLQVNQVMPMLRPFGIDSVTVAFFGSGAQFAPGDFTLSRNGGPDLLAGSKATFTPIANSALLIGNLADLTATAGDYTFTARNVTDLAGNTAATVNRFFTVANAGASIVGTASNDALYLRQNADGAHLDVWLNSATPGQGTPTQQIAVPTAGGPIQVLGLGGNDTLTLDFSSGGQFGAGAVAFDGGAGFDTVTVLGSSGNDLWTTDNNGGSVALSEVGPFVPLALAGAEGLHMIGGTPGIDTLFINGGAFTVDATTDPAPVANIRLVASGPTTVLNFASSQFLHGLRLISGATARLGSGSGQPLLLSVNAGIDVFQVDPLSRLDLENGALIVKGGNPSIIAGLVASGFHGGDWQGNGILSAAANKTTNMALGEATAADVGATTLAGQALASSDVIVRYTFYGDADLSGFVNGDDESLLLSGLRQGAAPKWATGDFDYSGHVNGDDCTLFLAGLRK